MSLGGAIDGALPLLQGQAESMMVDACTITRPGAETFDSTTGAYTGSPTTVYTGQCRVRTRSLGFLRDRQAEVGEKQDVIWPYTVAVPASVTDIRVLDVVTVTASRDPGLVGLALRVRIAGQATNSTARKMDCEQIADG